MGKFCGPILVAGLLGLCCSCSDFSAVLSDTLRIRRSYQAATQLVADGQYAAALEAFAGLWVESLSGSGIGRERIARLVALRAAQMCSERLNRPEESLSWYGRIVERFPGSTEAVLARERRAAIYSGKLGDIESAIEELHALVEMSRTRQGMERYQLEIAKLYYRRSDFKQALVEAADIVNARRGGEAAADAYLLMGRCFFLLEDYRSAVAMFKEVVTRFPESSKAGEARFELGESFERLGDYDRARKFFGEALKFHPNTDVVKVRLKRLDERLAARRDSGAADGRLLQPTGE